ncbi:SHUGOSHIN 1 [Hibiscus trionum]|uniref:SHUGOSHIN 1 n=1 Tax=Hibiscus trionum TaxID=183268 RepID=A0A9W7MW92_HIBTR|nr:SHUGOSHIN 1 [Hibiscus trionum]
MENSTILDTGNAVVAGNKLKGEIMENRCSTGNESRKGLSDISNLQQQHKVLNQGAKLLLQPDSIGTKEFIDKLQQENMMLMKVLADRNKVIKLSGIELQKLRINLEKFQQQNLLLAQANSQMLAELNLSKDRLKALKHELGCKDAVLKAIKLELGTNKCGMEVESYKEEDEEGKLCNINKCSEADESHEEDQGEDKPCNTNRKRQSYCLGPSNIKPVHVKEGVESKRVCSRRQSARRKAQEPETTEDVFEVDDPKCLASSTSDDKVLESGPSNIKPVLSEEGISNKSKVCSRRQSARRKAQEPETTGDVVEVDDPEFLASSTSDDKMLESGPSNIEPIQAKEVIDNKRKVCSRRQFVTCKAREPEATEDVFVVDDTRFLVFSTSDDKVYESGPSDIKPVQAKEGIDNKRACLRRQSGRFKPQEPETSKDVFEVDDARILVSSTSDGKVHESGQLSSDESSVKSEHDNGNMTVSSRIEAQELRRVSAGRPLRRAVEKVQSYKEMKLNVKMRRKE